MPSTLQSCPVDERITERKSKARLARMQAKARQGTVSEAPGREIARSFSATFLQPSGKGKRMFVERQARRDRYFPLRRPLRFFQLGLPRLSSFGSSPGPAF